MSYALSVSFSMLAKAAAKANGQACIEAVLLLFVPQLKFYVFLPHQII